MLDIPTPEVAGERVTGEVLRVDHFGNLVSNIDRRVFESFAQTATGGIQIEVGPQPIGRLVETYADIGEGEVCALFGSTDHLEFAANSASAAERLAVDRGAPVVVSTSVS